MGQKSEILAEIHSLIDEQFALLAKSMSPAQAAEYLLRKKRIGELLEHIGRNGHNEG